MGKTVNHSMAMLPAVTISMLISPPVMMSGLNHNSREPSWAPFVWALHSFAAVLTDCRCWGRSPGCFLLWRMFLMCKFCWMMADKAMDSRNIVPLPLFWLPSICSMFYRGYCVCLGYLMLKGWFGGW